MKSIAILTFSRACNYGAVLQAYALKKYLENKNYNVQIINYKQKDIENSSKIFLWKDSNRKFSIRALISSLVYLKFRLSRKLKFWRFSCKYLDRNSKIIHTYKDIPTNFDIYIHGSDQLWNPKLVGFDKVYWGYYKIKNNSYRITYAMSFESNSISKLRQNDIKDALNNFKYISLREDFLIDNLSPFTQKNIYSVLDPTLLVNSNIWEKFCVKRNTKPYLLFYQVGVTDLNKHIINDISNKLNLKIKVVSGPILRRNFYKNNPSPEEFLTLLYNASFIVSTSFHATTFAIIFKKQFYTIAANSGSDIRYYSLLSKLSLSDRIINKKDDVDLSKHIDYNNVSIKLEKLKKESEEYLTKALQDESL